MRSQGNRNEEEGMKKNTKSKEIILEVIRNNQRKIRAFGVRKTGLFGSFAAFNFSRQEDPVTL